MDTFSWQAGGLPSPARGFGAAFLAAVAGLVLASVLTLEAMVGPASWRPAGGGRPAFALWPDRWADSAAHSSIGRPADSPAASPAAPPATRPAGDPGHAGPGEPAPADAPADGRGAGGRSGGAGSGSGLSPVLLALAREYPGMDESARRGIAAAIEGEAQAHGLDPWLIYAIIKVESNFNVRCLGGAGERGLMQILPSTARTIVRLMARDGSSVGAFDPDILYEPAVNIRLATAYLAFILQHQNGDVARALTEYNTGSPEGAPNRYARRVLERYRTYAAAAAAPGPAGPRGA